MGLRTTIANATAAAFAATGDIPVTCSIARETGGTWNPVTESWDVEPTSATYTAQGILTAYRQSLVDGTVIQQGDRRLVVRQAELGVKPVNGETITVDGTDYTVVSWSADGAGSVYQIQVRA
jgi:hypothetical protein